MARSLSGEVKRIERFAWNMFIALSACLVLFAIYRAIRYVAKVRSDDGKKQAACGTNKGGYAKCDCK